MLIRGFHLLHPIFIQGITLGCAAGAAAPLPGGLWMHPPAVHFSLLIIIRLGIGLTADGLYMNGMLIGGAFAASFVVSMGLAIFGPTVTKNIADSVAKNLLTNAITGFVYIFLISLFNLFVTAGIHVFGMDDEGKNYGYPINQRRKS